MITLKRNQQTKKREKNIRKLEWKKIIVKSKLRLFLPISTVEMVPNDLHTKWICALCIYIYTHFFSNFFSLLTQEWITIRFRRFAAVMFHSRHQSKQEQKKNLRKCQIVRMHLVYGHQPKMLIILFLNYDVFKCKQCNATLEFKNTAATVQHSLISFDFMH